LREFASPSRRGDRLGRRGTHAFPDDGVQAAARADTERGFSGWVNAASSSSAYLHRQLADTLKYRPVVLTLWVIVVALIVPFYMFSQRELAPAEDQGWCFGIVQAAPNATIDQTKMFTAKIHDVYARSRDASIFQITYPGAASVAW